MLMLLSFLAVLTVNPLSAQTDQSSQPLHAVVQGIESLPSGQECLVLSLTNRSDKAIAGYTIVFKLTAQTARTNVRTIRTFGESVVLVSRPDFRPGETWRELVRGVPRNWDGSLASHSIDYVYFADGASWGPDLSRSGPYFEGMKAGSLAVRSALRRKLDEEGDSAVREFLTRH